MDPMQRANIDDLPNPFSTENYASPRRPTGLLRRVKSFALVACFFVVYVCVNGQYTRYRMARNSNDVASLTSQEKEKQPDRAVGHDLAENPPGDEAIKAADRPLPVEHLANGVQWTNWPPPAKRPPESTSLQQPALQQAIYKSEIPRPTLHQATKSPLQAVEDIEAVVLQPFSTNRTHHVGSNQPSAPPVEPPSTVQPTAHVIDTAWGAADLVTIIKSLGMPNSETQKLATAELAKRGFSQQQIAIAARIAGGNTQAKIALIPMLSQDPSIDARPWLMLLLDDSEREVRLRSITALAKLNDPWVKQQLKLKVVDEKDEAVAFRMRRVLNLR